ncbi:MAG: alanine--glyoxylate aminotransferase family protein, partial [Acidimicrobiia bacterium]|nr:alanine--glyoxylate aminotransferase family protein [Acidimicrobiia bacterium]
SETFQNVMNDISSGLKQVYAADAVAIVPGSGTFAMEAVARQLATDRRVLVLRNGWFSYRWTQIFDAGGIPAEATVLKARRSTPGPQEPFAPAPIDEVVTAITEQRPAVVFAPHVETSAGMILPDDYLSAVAAATHEVDGLFVLDCIASGTVWVDMADSGVDVLISAPQKGWSASPCSGLVMLSPAGREAVESSTSSSFACDLGKWRQIMAAYEAGGHAYHATMPTDALTGFRDVMAETAAYGFDKVKAQQIELGRRVRESLAGRGVVSVAAAGFGAPGVVVCYTDDPAIQNGARFAAEGIQIAAGVPLQCDEGDDFATFRLGLFGLDKLRNVDRSVESLDRVFDAVL